MDKVLALDARLFRISDHKGRLNCDNFPSSTGKPGARTEQYSCSAFVQIDRSVLTGLCIAGDDWHSRLHWKLKTMKTLEDLCAG
jgi:hypothetical protein